MSEEWCCVAFDLSDDEYGWLLESDEGLYAYPTPSGPRVPALRTAEDAEEFARRVVSSRAVVRPDGDFDLKAVEAHVQGVAKVDAEEAYDAWVFLAAVAMAAGRGEACGAPEQVTAEADPGVVRASLRAGLAVFREVVVYVELDASMP